MVFCCAKLTCGDSARASAAPARYLRCVFIFFHSNRFTEQLQKSALHQLALNVRSRTRDVGQLLALAQPFESDDLTVLHLDGALCVSLRVAWLEHDHAAFIAKYRVARLDHLPADTDRHIDLTLGAKNFRGDRRRSAAPDRHVGL